MTSNAKQPHRYSPSFCASNQFVKILELQKKRGGGERIQRTMSPQLENYVVTGFTVKQLLIWKCLVPLFKTFPSSANIREIVFLTQFPVTRFQVNAIAARVRNNSLLHFCSHNEFPINSLISSNWTCSLSIEKEIKHALLRSPYHKETYLIPNLTIVKDLNLQS